MNKSKVPTVEKIMVPLRLSPSLYKKVRTVVNERKDEERGYSINEYLTELITEDLKGRE